MVNIVDINDNECRPDFASEFSGPPECECEHDEYDRDRAAADALPPARWAAVGTPNGGAR